jgi:TolA-binding protein
MRHRTLTGVLPCLFAAALACTTASNPSPFAVRAAAAQRAYAHGRYEQAARIWDDARSVATSPRNREEASYRTAVSLKRADRTDEAIAIFETIARSSSSRAPRAALTLAQLEHRRGNAEGQARWLDALVQHHPESAEARRAVVMRTQRLDDPAAKRRYLAAVWQGDGASSLRERAGYELARHLEAEGDPVGAAAQYDAVATRFPYPRGALWDDALYRLAEVLHRLGRTRDAIGRLEALLSYRERSTLQGSYERPRFAQARFRIAELYRDALRDPEQARSAFREVWKSHPTSRLRDDALWEAALIAAREGWRAQACADLEELARGEPLSRYVPCAGHLCPSHPPPDSCRGYIERRLVAPMTRQLATD